MVNRESITNILLKNLTIAQKGTALIDLANANGGRDNITVVLVKNDKATFIHEATKPVSQPKKKKTATIVPAATPYISEKTDPENTVVSANEQDKKHSSKLNPLLFFIAFIVLAAIAYFVWQHNDIAPAPTPIPDSTSVEPSQAFKLQDTLNKLKGNILILDTTIFKSPIVIKEPIRINRDSLYLKADRNLVIKSDTGYKGQAFLIGPANKSTLLENFTFENFDDVSALQKKGVLLKNVQFIKTDIPAVKRK